MAAAPVMLFVWTYFGYTLINWRHRDGDDEDGPPLFGHTGIQATWIGGTAVIVLAAFVFGTVELIIPAGAGAGEGPDPVWKPPAATCSRCRSSASSGSSPTATRSSAGWRPPSWCCPDNRAVAFHVTSLDVIHSFWAYQLGVKADANPGVDNVAYTTPKHIGGFTVRCNELCGIWHGAMFNSGRVVTPAGVPGLGHHERGRSSGSRACWPRCRPTR